MSWLLIERHTRINLEKKVTRISDMVNICLYGEVKTQF